MVISERFSTQNLIQIYTKLHHFKKFVPNPPSFATYKFPNLKNILAPPPPVKSWLRPWGYANVIFSFNDLSVFIVHSHCSRNLCPLTALQMDLIQLVKMPLRLSLMSPESLTCWRSILMRSPLTLITLESLTPKH